MRWLGVAATSLLLMATLVQSAPAAARDIEWCDEDPVFQVLGANFRITTTVSAAAASVGGIAYSVDLPSNAAGSAVVRFPSGYPVRTTVTLSYKGAAYDGSSATFPVKVTVYVTGPDGTSVSSALTGPSVTNATFAGSTNSKLTFRFDAAGR